MQTSHFIIASALLLSACGKAPEKADYSDNATSSITTDNEATDAANSFSPEQVTNGMGATSAMDKVIPAAFHGRWGMVPGDCGPDAAIAKGLMVVDGSQLRFYESVGKPAVITNPTPSSIEGRFSFTGEGMEWSKDMVITLEGDGDKLVRVESDPKASYTYSRCPS